MKAFLSHSSKDKELVLAVANQLGRQYAIVDQQVFETGNDFRNLINKYLDESSVFVLFASKCALDSSWVQFELDEAFMRKVQSNISKCLVFLIDTVDISDIPAWLRRALIKRIVSPKAIAREIRYHLDELFRQKDQQFFYGRNNDLIRLQKELMPIDGSEAPRIFFVNGLPGIGRRTFVRRGAADFLNLKRSVVIKIENSETVHDIAISIASHITPFATVKAFEASALKLRTLSEKEAVSRIIDDLRSMARNGEIPILYDDGGVLDENGDISAAIKNIISMFAKDDEAYLGIVTRRRPFTRDIPCVSIDPISKDDVKRLLYALFGDMEQKVTVHQINELAEFIGGYPPSAHYACKLGKDYGLDLILHDKSRVVDFRAGAFVKYLTTVALKDEHYQALKLLATYSPLPIKVIGDVLGHNAEALSSLIIFLKDHSLITIDEHNNYSISDPVRDAINRSIGFAGEIEANKVINSINDIMNESDTEVPHVDVMRVAFRARALTSDPDYKSFFHFSSDLIRLTKEFYHRRMYKEAINFARLALKELPDNSEIHGFLIRSYAQEERFPESLKALNDSKSVLNLKDYYYNLGFYHRKDGDIPKAIDAYEHAIAQGRGGVAVFRELAQCFIEENKETEALKYINKAYKLRPDNRFVVDLKVAIAVRVGSEEDARNGLSQLKLIEDDNFFKHRESTVELKFGSAETAYSASKEAVALSARPTFSMIAQLTQCAIRTNRLPEAKVLIDEIMSMRKHKDVAVGLNCRYLIEKGDFSDALMSLNELRKKDKIIYKYMKRDAITGLLENVSLPDNDRLKYENELASLITELNNDRHLEIDLFLDAEL